jgi:hypothetical protein
MNNLLMRTLLRINVRRCRRDLAGMALPGDRNWHLPRWLSRPDVPVTETGPSLGEITGGAGELCPGLTVPGPK